MGAVFLTGSTGFLGMELLARWLERTDRTVYALVRAPGRDAARERLRHEVETSLGQDLATTDRLVAVPGDIEQPGLGLDRADREEIEERATDVVHAAASVSFTLPLPESRSVNVEGTRHVLELAEGCARHGEGLHHLSYVSTAYVAGTHAGEFAEDQLDVGQRFRNPYELTKFEAERLVRSYADRLPVQVLRPSIIVGERSSGWTRSFNVLYSPLKAFARGALPAVPARRSAPVDVVPVDYVADATFELANSPDGEGGTYHLVAGREAATVGHLIDLSARSLGKRRPVILPPRIYRRLVHPLLVRLGPKRRRQALERMRVFFPYFAMEVEYRNDRARRRLAQADVKMTPVETYFGRLVRFATRAGWGRKEIDREKARADARPV